VRFCTASTRPCKQESGGRSAGGDPGVTEHKRAEEPCSRARSGIGRWSSRPGGIFLFPNPSILESNLAFSKCSATLKSLRR